MGQSINQSLERKKERKKERKNEKGGERKRGRKKEREKKSEKVHERRCVTKMTIHSCLALLYVYILQIRDCSFLVYQSTLPVLLKLPSALRKKEEREVKEGNIKGKKIEKKRKEKEKKRKSKRKEKKRLTSPPPLSYIKHFKKSFYTYSLSLPVNQQASVPALSSPLALSFFLSFFLPFFPPLKRANQKNPT